MSERKIKAGYTCHVRLRNLGLLIVSVQKERLEKIHELEITCGKRYFFREPFHFVIEIRSIESLYVAVAALCVDDYLK